MNITNFDQVND